MMETNCRPITDQINQQQKGCVKSYSPCSSQLVNLLEVSADQFSKKGTVLISIPFANMVKFEIILITNIRAARKISYRKT
jgi:hypothetical protein